jgi:hypothetical protein
MKNKLCKYGTRGWMGRVAAIVGLGMGLGLGGVNGGEAVPPDATQLMEGHLKAIGGRAVLEKITTQVIKGSASEGGHEFDLEIQFQSPDKALFIGSVADGFTIRMGLTPSGKGWRQDPSGVREFTGDNNIAEMYQFLSSLGVPALLRWQEHATKLIWTGDEMRGQQQLRRVRFKSARGETNEFAFEASSGLLVGLNKSELSDYRVVEGVKVPHVLKGGDSFTVRVKEVRFNVPLQGDILEEPAGVPVITDANAYSTQLSPPGKMAIVRRPLPMNMGKRVRKELPVHDWTSSKSFQVDLRGSDCSGLDLKGRAKDLLRADFDDRTVWPTNLPEGFEPKKIMELGQTPGLRVKELHRRGITGKGIGVGIIDQNLLVDHAEYADRLKLYEEVHAFQGEPFAAMHGPAVASIAVGKQVGVAPEAELYYIAETHGTFAEGKFNWDFTWLAKAIDRLVEVNQSLPAEKKMRVISISVGWTSDQKGFAEAGAAVERARKAGIFVISTSLETIYKLAFHGLGREPLQNPDDCESYGPGSWWAKSFYDGKQRFAPGQRLLVPMDSRCTASPTGPREYVFYADGGWSWSVPYLAGLYALACQVRPAVTPETFWAEAMKTGDTIKVKHGGEPLEFGTIVNPVALIEKLQKAD